MSVNNESESSRAQPGARFFLFRRYILLSHPLPPSPSSTRVFPLLRTVPFLHRTRSTEAAVGVRCRARVICRGGYESAEYPSGRNIILNDDIGGARGAAETAGRAFHVRGVTREMKITGRVRTREGLTCMCGSRTYID